MKESVQMALVKKSEEVNRQAEFILSKTRDWQVIKKYMSNRLADITLTKEQEKKMERYQFIYNQLAGGEYGDNEVVILASKKFNISQTQAYEDINATKEVFSSVININKLFELNLALQLNNRYKAKAEDLGDMKALAAFEKNRMQLLKLLPEAEDTMPELFEGHTYEMVFDPSLLGAPSKVDMKEILQMINAKRGKKVKLDMFEELDHEDIAGDGS